MMIEILIDPFGVNSSSTEGAAVVDTQDQYLEACHRINQAAADGSGLRVIVRNKAMRDWFDHYRNRAGVTIRNCDPCAILAEVLGLTPSKLPDVLRQDPAAVVDLGLIDLARRSKPTEGQTPISWMLDVTVGPPWGKGAIENQSDLDDLLVYLCRSGGAPLTHAAVIALQAEVRTHWSEAGPFALLLRWLFSGQTARRAETLIISRLMRRYPFETRVEALGFEGRWTELCQLEAHDAIVDDLGPFTRPGFRIPAGPTSVIRHHLNTGLAESGLKGVLPAISGYVAEEEKVIRAYLRDKAGEIDLSWEQDLASLRRVFVQNESAATLVDMISELRPVAEPAACNPESSWEDVSHWLETQYFPYYRWAVAVNRVGQTEDTASSFERWLVGNYDALTRSDVLLAACLRQRILDQLKVGDCMLIVVDSLPWSLAPAYSTLASRSNLVLLGAQPKISVIPTITEIAKPSLVRGQLPGQLALAGAGTSYYHNLISESVGLPREQIACGSSNDTSLFELARSHKRMMLYMLNSADELVHKRLPADKRRERIEEELSKLLEDVSEALKEHRDTGRGSLSVLIVSDHGYTEVPNTAGCCLDIPDGLQESHGRVAYGATEQVCQSNDVWVIPSELMGGGSVAYAVAKGYSFFGPRPQGASHGGLTPQEVVVPLLVVGDQVAVEYRDCEVALVGRISRGLQCNPVVISVANPNDAQVVVEHVSLRLTKLLHDGPWVLESGGCVDIEAEVDASHVRTRDVQVTGSLMLRGPAGRRSSQISIRVETVGAAIADTRFDDDFDL